jgi:hypothetical protein
VRGLRERRRPAGRLLVGAALALAVGCGNPQAAGAGPPAEPLSPAATVQPVVLDPQVPGWSPVRSVSRAAAYDVPPSWQVLTETTIVGYESGNDRVAASGAAQFGAGVCGSENATLALSGVKHDTGTDLARAADATAREWADLAYRDDKQRRPRLTVGQPETITTRGGQPATVVKVTARTASRAGACKLTEGAVYAVAATGFTGELGPTAILVVVADVGRPDAVPEPEIREILGTLRPA